LRTQELANGNGLTAKLLAEPTGLGAAFVSEIALGRAVVEPEPGWITGSAGSRAVPHQHNVPAGSQIGPQGRGVILGSGIFRHSGRPDPQDEQHNRQDAHRPNFISSPPGCDRSCDWVDRPITSASAHSTTSRARARVVKSNLPIGDGN
jgi:hypothetical protein